MLNFCLMLILIRWNSWTTGNLCLPSFSSENQQRSRPFRVWEEYNLWFKWGLILQGPALLLSVWVGLHFYLSITLDRFGHSCNESGFPDLMFSYIQNCEGLFTGTPFHVRTLEAFPTEECKLHKITREHCVFQIILHSFKICHISKNVC